MGNYQEKNNVKILCLSFWTPPIVRPQSILIGKMIPEWVRQNASPIIITYDICGKWEMNVPIYTISQHKIKNRFFALPIFRLIDEYFYYKKLFRIGKKAVQEKPIDVIFSFSNPQSSNTMGAMMKKKLGIPFIAYMSDPWYDNHYKPLRGLALWKTYRMERFVVKWADKIIFPSEACRNLVMKKYSKEWQEKSLVIPHCFDPSDYPQAQISASYPRKSTFVISYIGAFYKERNPEPLFKALKEIMILP